MIPVTVIVLITRVRIYIMIPVIGIIIPIGGPLKIINIHLCCSSAIARLYCIICCTQNSIPVVTCPVSRGFNTAAVCWPVIRCILS